MEKEWYIDSCGTRRQGFKRICENCSCEYITRHDKKDRQQKFCSRNCVLETKNKTKFTIVECAYCKKLFQKRRTQLKSSKSGFYFCNRICKESAQKLGGLKEIMPQHYGTGSSRLKKDVATDRFNIKLSCCDCNENKEYLLCIHHVDGNPTNNIEENLEIVCFNCHAKRHLEFKNNKWINNFKKLTPREKLGEL